MAARIRIGEILLRAGVIDQHQLNSALGEQRKWGRPLGATLVKLGLVEERELVRALASQLSLPVASLDGKRIPKEVLSLVPGTVAQKRMVLPLFVKNTDSRSTLYLAMEDPGDLAVLDDLAFRTGLQVKPVMMAPSELFEGIDRYYRDAVEGEATPAREIPQSAPADVIANDEVALDALQTETLASGAAADDGASTSIDSGAGTEELVRHFKGGGDPTPSDATAGAEEASDETPLQSSFDETALAAPPPRAPSALASDEPLHPPVESLSSYDAKTRTILHVLTQLLIESGVISREDLHARISALSNVEHDAD